MTLRLYNTHWRGQGHWAVVQATVANIHDVTMLAQLLNGEEISVYGDSGYLGAEKREETILRNNHGKKIRYKINLHLSQTKMLPSVQRPRSSAVSGRNPPSKQKPSTFSL